MKDLYGYGITDDGRVWSYKRNHWLKPFTRNNGYQRVVLNRTSYYVHRLVLESHVGPAPPGTECRHLDGNASNNHLSNLCWGTRADNGKDKVRHGTLNLQDLKEQNDKVRKLSISKARFIRQSNLSKAKLAKAFHCSPGAIQKVRQYKTYRESYGT